VCQHRGTPLRGGEILNRPDGRACPAGPGLRRRVARRIHPYDEAVSRFSILPLIPAPALQIRPPGSAPFWRFGRGAALCLIAAAAAACTRAPGAGPASGLHAWTQPDLLRAAMIANPNTLNPILSTQQFEAQAETLVLDPLVATDPSGHDVPILAERVPTLENGDISRDGLSLTYHLRHGVVWHDGAPFTSRDVRFTWQAIMNPRNLVPTRHGYDQIVSIDTPTPWTAVFHLKRPFAPAVHTFFAHSDAPYMILPAHLLARYADLNQIPYNSQPVGTGPYKIVRWYRGDRIEYVANHRYFLGRPHIERIVLHFVGDENSIANQVRAHEVDWFVTASPRVYPQLRGIDGISIRLVPFNGSDSIIFNTERKPFSDVRVRRAVQFAIDKELLVKEVTYGTTIAATEDLPSFMWAFDPRAGSTRRDLASARKLLDAAGWRLGPDGIRTKNGARLVMGLAYRSDSLTDRNRGVLIASMLREAGIDVTLKGYQTAMLYGPQSEHGILASGTYDGGLETWYAGVDPDDSTQLMCDQRPPLGYNWARYCNPRLDAAERSALSHYDEPTRKRAYAVVQEALAADVPFIYLWWPRAIEPVNSDLRGFAPNGIIEDWNAYQWRFGSDQAP
jgi:peptide/nickel transport system substrate-binding protein